jgi:hypothetical protein
MRRKKPDLMVVLAVLIGLGVLVTEITYGQTFSSSPTGRTAQSR